MQGLREVLTSFCICVAVAACGSPETGAGGPLNAHLSRLEDVLTPERDSVGVIGAIRMGPDGALWFVDGANSQIVRVDPATGDLRQFGRSGDGPGEFRFPESIAVREEDLLVYDVGTGRISLHALDGAHIRDTAIPGRMIGPVSMNKAGDLLAPTMGREGGLAALWRVDSDSTLYVGNVVAPPFARPLGELQADAAQRREVPPEFKNLVRPVLADDGRMWLIPLAEGDIRAYDPTGAEVWATPLPDSAVESARSTYLSRIADSQGRLFFPNAVTDAQLVGEKLWIVVNALTAGETAVLVLDARTGQERAVLRLGDFESASIAPDTSGGVLYVALPTEARIARFGLPEM